jgi:hypothetical protein
MPSLPSTRFQVGASLEEARQRAGLSIDEAADLTKIRVKYLRALETEDWDVLPSAAYAKGFLRTYARTLGLDADPFVDEYRRRVESGSEPERLLPFGDPVLEGRDRPPGLQKPRRRTGPFLAGLAVALLAVALVLLIADGLGDSSPDHRRAAHRAARHHRRHQGQHRHHVASMPSGPVALRLHLMNGAQVCLVSGGRALIDSQSLSPGAKAGPFHGRRFRLDLASFGGGALRLRIDHKTRKIHARGRATYNIRGKGVSRIPYRGPRCP